MTNKLLILLLAALCASAAAVDRAIILEGAELITVEGPAAPSSARHPEYLSDQIYRRQSDIVNIFNEIYNENPEVQGRLVVMFTLEADGTVSGCVPVENTTGSEELAERICGFIESWWLLRCPEEAYQTWATVTVPYEFLPADEPAADTETAVDEDDGDMEDEDDGGAAATNPYENL